MKINEKNLATFATIPPFDCVGFLNKRGEVNKAFQRRWFVLKGNLLFYFERPTDKEPLGLIIVEGCTIELSEESSNYCFEIAFNGNRTYVLCADTQDNMELWMKALTCAGYEYKKLMVAELQRQLKEIEESSNKVFNENLNNSLVIRPPPRRSNPFNRPAPPPPTNINGNNINSEINFVNSHFDSSLMLTNKPQSKLGIVGDNTATRPHKTSKAIATKSQFYDYSSDQPSQPSQPLQLPQQQPPPRQKQSVNSIKSAKQSNTVLNTGASTGAIPRNQNSANDMRRTFEEMHEEYRQQVMRDIREYNDSKTPLFN